MAVLSGVTDVARPSPTVEPPSPTLRRPPAAALTSPASVSRPPPSDAALFLYAPFVTVVALTFASSPDDPFVTLRYAANLVHGYGLAFNRGQHVQGFTSPLHLLVAVVAYLTPGGHDLFKLKVASLVFGLLAVREAGRLLYGVALPRWARRTGCLAVATSWVVAFSSSNGLETTLVMWLLMVLARRLVIDGPRRSPLLLSLLSFAAVLARPDALLAVAFMAAASLVIERRLAWWRRCSWFAGAALAAAGLILFGALYFGEPLPNTYFAKDLTLGHAVSDGVRYLITSLQPGTFSRAWGGLSSGLLLIQAVLLVAGIHAVRRRLRRSGYLVALVAAQTLFIVRSGGDWMKGGRFIAPAIVPLIVLELLGLVELRNFVHGQVRPRMAGTVFASVSCLLVVGSALPLWLVHAPVWQIHGGLNDRALIASGHYEPFSQIWATLPQDVRCLRAGQLVATSEVGYLGFTRQDLRLLDLRGLTNQAIARSSPAADKNPTGVDDPDWFLPSSPVGRVLLRDKPALIATFDTPAQNRVLGGAYRLSDVTDVEATPLSFYVPDSSPDPCAG